MASLGVTTVIFSPCSSIIYPLSFSCLVYVVVVVLFVVVVVVARCFLLYLTSLYLVSCIAYHAPVRVCACAHACARLAAGTEQKSEE